MEITHPNRLWLYHLLCWVFFGAASIPVANAACHSITNEHVDLRVTYQSAPSPALSLVIYDDEQEQGFSTNEVFIVGGESARLTLPAGTPFGNAGESIWVLPQTSIPDLPKLGISGEGLPDGLFADNSVHIRLIRVDGPGHFILWQTLGPGQFEIFMDSRNGISAADAKTIGVDAHQHVSWGFTTSGLYRITFQAAGVLAGQSQPVTGPEHTFIFHLLPLRPFENWQATNWPCECNPQLISPGADPDADGQVNAAEYAQGSNPLLADVHLRPQATVIWHDGTPYGALIFHRSKSATDILRLPVAASQFQGDSWETLTQIHHLEDLGEIERITIRDNQPLNQSSKRWYQLRVQSIP